MDAQALIEGIGPMASLPKPLARIFALSHFAAPLDAPRQRAEPRSRRDAARRIRPRQAALGAELLRTRFIRKTANDLSYQNPALATEDAIRVGAIHTREPQWVDNTVVRGRALSFLMDGERVSREATARGWRERRRQRSTPEI